MSQQMAQMNPAAGANPLQPGQDPDKLFQAEVENLEVMEHYCILDGIEERILQDAGLWRFRYLIDRGLQWKAPSNLAFGVWLVLILGVRKRKVYINEAINIYIIMNYGKDSPSEHLQEQFPRMQPFWTLFKGNQYLWLCLRKYYTLKTPLNVVRAVDIYKNISSTNFISTQSFYIWRSSMCK